MRLARASEANPISPAAVSGPLRFTHPLALEAGQDLAPPLPVRVDTVPVLRLDAQNTDVPLSAETLPDEALFVEAIDLSTGALVARTRAGLDGRFAVTLPDVMRLRPLLLQATNLDHDQVTMFLAATLPPAPNASTASRDLSPSTTLRVFALAKLAGIRDQMSVDRGFRGLTSRILATMVFGDDTAVDPSDEAYDEAMGMRVAAATTQGLTIQNNSAPLEAQRNLVVDSGLFRRALSRLGPQLPSSPDQPLRQVQQQQASCSSQLGQLETADGGMLAISATLGRVRELLAQLALPGLTNADRQALLAELKNQLPAIDTVALGSRFDDRVLLVGNYRDVPLASEPGSEAPSISLPDCTVAGLGLGTLTELGTDSDVSAAVPLVDSAMHLLSMQCEANARLEPSLRLKLELLASQESALLGTNVVQSAGTEDDSLATVESVSFVSVLLQSGVAVASQDTGSGPSILRFRVQATAGATGSDEVRLMTWQVGSQLDANLMATSIDDLLARARQSASARKTRWNQRAALARAAGEPFIQKLGGALGDLSRLEP